MSSAFFVYGEDAERPDGREKARLITSDFAEALAEFVEIVQEEEHGKLVWSS